MDGETLFLIFSGIMIVALLIIVGVFGSKTEKKHNGTQYGIDFESEMNTNSIHAKVVDLSCAVLSEGYRSPRIIKEFLVTFEADDGKVLKYKVNEEMYNGFEKGQEGLLTVTDSIIYGFVLD